MHDPLKQCQDGVAITPVPLLTNGMGMGKLLLRHLRNVICGENEIMILLFEVKYYLWGNLPPSPIHSRSIWPSSFSIGFIFLVSLWFSIFGWSISGGRLFLCPRWMLNSANYQILHISYHLAKYFCNHGDDDKQLYPWFEWRDSGAKILTQYALIPAFTIPAACWQLGIPLFTA